MTTRGNSIRVMVVDDHPMTRRGLAAFLRVHSDLELVAEAANGNTAIESCSELVPDVVLMDMVMPGIDGPTATGIIRQQCPNTKVIALTSYQDGSLVQRALQAGALSFLYKDVSADDLAAAIRLANAGFGTLSPVATRTVAKPQASTPSRTYGLTSREMDVLRLMVAGMNNTKIAGELTVSASTVKTHVSSILHKLGVASRSEAVGLAVREHIVS